LFGLLAGLIIGLAAAAAVAYFVTQVPMPFVDKASRDPAQTLLPEVRDAPDPNIGLYGRDSPAGTSPTGPTATAPAPLPDAPQGDKPPASMSDDIGALLATLGAPDASKAPAAAQSKPPAATAPAAPAAPQASKPTGTQTTYYLQAGAFRAAGDADAVKAQVLMLGLPAQVQPAQVNGGTVYRVRVGPFKGIDEMNRSRVRLGEAKIESSVVRP